MVISPDGKYGIVSNGYNNSLTVMSLAAIETSPLAAGVRTISLGTPTRAPALDISDPNPANWGTSAFIAPGVDGLASPTQIVSGTVNGTTKVFVTSNVNPGLVQCRTL